MVCVTTQINVLLLDCHMLQLLQFWSPMWCWCPQAFVVQDAPATVVLITPKALQGGRHV
jgi:hypothetical protein